jgi:NTE family protein
MKIAVVFQGGGALGAFSAGAWEELAPRLPGSSIIAVAGVSIGAVHAAIVARQLTKKSEPASVLVDLWRNELSTPALPFLGVSRFPVPPSSGTVADWNGFLTGLLVGARGLYAAAWPNWSPGAGLGRLARPLHDRGAMWAMLERRTPPYTTGKADRPMLAVAAVDVMTGMLHLFDSDRGVGPQEVAASSALPLLFDPVVIDGVTYWDGEVTRESFLPLLLHRLLASGRLRRGEKLHVITVEQIPRRIAAMPASGTEMMLTLMQADKFAIEDDRIARLVRICREPLPEDGVSSQFDYSLARIDRLIAQGREAAKRTLAEEHFA